MEPVIFIAGHDPRRTGCGHCHYVLMHAHAASAADYEPHIFFLSASAQTTRAAYGVLHAVPWGIVKSASQRTVPLHARRIAKSIRTFVQATPTVNLLHSFGVWGYVGVRVQQELCRSGRKLKSLVSVYTSYVAEHQHLLEVLRPTHGFRESARQGMITAWVNHVVRRAESKSLNASDLVTLNYRSVERDIGLQGYRPQRVRLLPYTIKSAFTGMASSRDAPGPTDSVTPVIVTLSRQIPKKGIDVFLHALVQLKQQGQNFRVFILGSGNFQGAHEQLSARLGLSSQVTFTGFVSSIWDYLQQADIYVLPSLREESGSLALIEALQCGIPVVASAVDGIVEDIQDGENGILVTPGDSGALMTALSRLIREEGLRHQLAQGARRLFDSRFSAEVVVKAIADTYRTLSS